MRFLFSRPPSRGTRAGILLDRDGLINTKVEGGYVTDWSQFKLVRGIKVVLEELSMMGAPLIVVSNQAGVGKGIVSPRVLTEITGRFVDKLASAGGRVDAVYYCPHRKDENCNCRKPRPGLLERAAQDWRLDLNRSVLIGDSPTDVEAALSVGCRAIWFVPINNVSRQLEIQAAPGVRVVRTLGSIPSIVRNLLQK